MASLKNVVPRFPFPRNSRCNRERRATLRGRRESRISPLPPRMPPPSISWGSPLAKTAKPSAKKASPPDPIKELKKLQPKPRVSKSAARAILGEKKGVDTLRALWVEQWIDNLVRNNCYPPQLVSDDFIAKLGQLFAPDKATEILAHLRSDFRLQSVWEDPTNYDFLVEAMKADKHASLFFSNPSLDFLREW
jgi:hypothetical protein